MSDYSVKRSYRGEVLVAPPGADPIEGEWISSRDNKRYFRIAPHRKDVMKYGRSSKAGENLKGGDGLAKWKSAMAAMGVVMSDAARSEIVTLLNEYDGDPYYKGDDGGTESGKSRLMRAVDKAAEIAGASSAASRGTEFHKLAEIVNHGKTPNIVQKHMVGPLAHYKERLAPVKFLAQEILIINDDLKRAGSIDYLLEVPAGTEGPDGRPLPEPWVVSSDLKTGKRDAKYPAGVAAQLAAYGLGCRYDQATNTRTPLHESVNTEWAVLVHYPLASADPRVGFYWVNLRVGLEAARLSNRIDEMVRYFGSVAGQPIPFEIGA